MRKLVIAFMFMLILNGFPQDYPELPTSLNPLLTKDGKALKLSDWSNKKAEMLSLLKENIYGVAPVNQEYKLTFDTFESSDSVLKGKAIRKQVCMTVSNNRGELKVNILIYLPKTDKPVPVFLGYNFGGNHSLTADPEIPVFDKDKKVRARGEDADSYPIEEILSQGYGFISVCYKEIDLDEDDNFAGGIHALLDPQEWQKNRPKNAWGSIGAWAWGLQRIMDYIETDKTIDKSKVALWGFSRLGKAALWAGAVDERFGMIISHESGCGGAAFSRRKMGETVKKINRFTHWFCDQYNTYNDKEEEAPFDQHMLLALQAPRPLLVTSGDGDKWSDPEGEFVSTLYASPVYEFLGKKGLGTKIFPNVNEPVLDGQIGYYIHKGPHNIKLYDWQQFMKFADLHLK